ncbi:ABC transporter ATP-binding protein [Campylobacter sp. RM12642]|uniref:ABC transporter ATP-binding protein n=1 Tax=unclassified Campylobacter TaxID=2593542 RepID=UPI001BDA6161|nr:ABC transporter ATP-binding protein [Campylobacter sp. 2018MI01]MBZ7980120.1 ABC transporter ATP-binding protein [Campylobacter sp. RM12642]MBZ7984223.1 ABC transporter ATP-binding protein [Campylobacter sp. RM12647]MBZ7992856.1 ABC transporter ATP-binding protein [Campylobacter sp. RM9333]MBZ8007617.1 ABC transporter ATP-binding protein [Campylobacter sp. RM9334]MBT0878407.1 ABC transporter ATP-binding protein/permease [Campylobacter sp. 2018MI01]
MNLKEIENQNVSQLKLSYVLKRFKHYFKDYKIRFFLAIIGMILASAGTAGSAKIIEPILNKIFVEKDVTLLYILPLGVFALYFIKNLGLYMQTINMGFIGIEITKRLRQKILKKIIVMDMKFFQKHPSGELISRSLNDIGSLQNVLTNFIPDITREIITTLGLLYVVISQSPKLAFFAFIILPAAMLPIRYFIKKLKSIGIATQQNYAELTSRLNEILGNIELVKSSNAEKLELEKYKNSNENVAKLIYRGTKINAFTSPIMETFGALGVSATIIIGGMEVINGSMQIGNFFSFLTALFLIYTPVKRITSLYASLQTNLAASTRTFYLLDLEPEIKGGDENLNQEIKSLKLQNASLKYDNKLALDNVSIEFKKGEITAIIGRSGSGKSSLVNTILRFYELNSGEIKINNNNYKNYSLDSLREKIAIVTQNIYLFSDTIANNIAYANEFDEERVINALKLANAYDFISAMPDGIYTKLSEKGNNFSGGQRQRLALARAFYKNPEIIIFDEATSALDNESQNLISKSLVNIKQDKIIILIAHRLNSIAIADNILILDNSKMVGFGNDKSLENNEFYKKLKEKFEEC